jgi:outer membrane protein TolC
VAENRLDVLRGNASDGVNSVTHSSFPKLSAAPTVGVPAHLLVRRPDLRAPQLQLISEDYRIAEAIADRLPRVGIGASLEYAESALTGDLIRTAVADAVQPLIDWGERKAEVERRRAVFDEKLARFTEAYLVAIEEVENLIYLGRRQQDRLSSLIHQRDLSSRTLEEARNRYSNGLTDYLPVLDSVQTLQRIERQVIAQQRGLIENRIALHLAIGGSLKDS